MLRNSLKEMMTPELAARTLQLYTGLMEDFFGLPARAPEVRTWLRLPDWLPVLPQMPHALRGQSVSGPCCAHAQCPIVRMTDDGSIGAAAGAGTHGR